jgi:hypothetical protein
MLLSIVIGLLFVGAAVAVTLGTHWATRKLFGRDSHKDKELASSVLTRIAALHALILALVFAQEMVDYQQLRGESATEANAIADLYNDARRFGGPEAIKVADAATEYLDRVITQDWPSLASERHLSRTAWASWETAYENALALSPADERQKSLRDHMLDSVHTISEQRVKREMIGQDEVSALFWFAAIAGLLFSAAAFYPYDPERRSLLLLSMFGAFTGIVLYLIYAFSNPYRPPGAIEPGAFVRLKAAIAADSKS